MLLALSLVFLIAIGCSGSPAVVTGPDTFTCEYDPFGDGSVEFTTPTREQLGEFDEWARVRSVAFYEDTGNGTQNDLEFREVVSGTLGEDRIWRVSNGFGMCLETGKEYYVLINEGTLSGNLDIPHPWATFPVINNRITLHPDMRKDDLIGDFHGLDPVLFKRRFVEFVGRDDIRVD